MTTVAILLPSTENGVEDDAADEEEDEDEELLRRLLLLPLLWRELEEALVAVELPLVRLLSALDDGDLVRCLADMWFSSHRARPASTIMTVARNRRCLNKEHNMARSTTMRAVA